MNQAGARWLAEWRYEAIEPPPRCDECRSDDVGPCVRCYPLVERLSPESLVALLTIRAAVKPQNGNGR